jgi:hypothetical protein
MSRRVTAEERWRKCPIFQRKEPQGWDFYQIYTTDICTGAPVCIQFHQHGVTNNVEQTENVVIRIYRSF